MPDKEKNSAAMRLSVTLIKVWRPIEDRDLVLLDMVAEYIDHRYRGIPILTKRSGILRMLIRVMVQLAEVYKSLTTVPEPARPRN